MLSLSLRNVGVLLVFPLVYGIIPVIFWKGFGYPNPPLLEYQLLSVLDLFLSLFVAAFFAFYKREAIQRGLALRLGVIFRSRFFLVLIIVSCMVLVYEGLKSLELIFQGLSRDELKDYGRVSLHSIILSSLVLFFLSAAVWLNAKIKILLVVGSIGAMLITASRSEVLVVFYFLYVFLLFSVKINFKRYAFYTFLIIIFISLFTVFFQGRGGGVMIALEKFFQYRGVSLYLADESIRQAQNSPDLLFPFMGRFYDQVASWFGVNSSIPASFHIDYRYIGYNEKHSYHMWGNVVYPWWTWFFGFFGVLGLYFKLIFLTFFIWLFVNLRLYFSFVFLMTALIWTSQTVHPLLSSRNSYLFLFLFLLDLFFLANIMLSKIAGRRCRT